MWSGNKPCITASVREGWVGSRLGEGRKALLARKLPRLAEGGRKG